MSFQADENTESGSTSTVLKVIVLSLFAVVIAIVSVSFAANHMRNGFEKEYTEQINTKTEQAAASSALLINGDEISADAIKAQTKYASILPALMVDSKESYQSKKIYGLYIVSNEALTPMLLSSDTGLIASTIPVTDWLTADNKPYVVKNDGQTTVLTQIKDSKGNVVALFELSSTYTFLKTYGNTVERRVLMNVLVAVAAGIGLFSLQYIIPSISMIIKRRGERY